MSPSQFTAPLFNVFDKVLQPRALQLPSRREVLLRPCTIACSLLPFRIPSSPPLSSSVYPFRRLLLFSRGPLSAITFSFHRSNLSAPQIFQKPWQNVILLNNPLRGPQSLPKLPTKAEENHRQLIPSLMFLSLHFAGMYFG